MSLYLQASHSVNVLCFFIFSDMTIWNAKLSHHYIAKHILRFMVYLSAYLCLDQQNGHTNEYGMLQYLFHLNGSLVGIAFLNTVVFGNLKMVESVDYYMRKTLCGIFIFNLGFLSDGNTLTSEDKDSHQRLVLCNGTVFLLDNLKMFHLSILLHIANII